MSFSIRHGYEQVKKIQVESMDNELRIGLWNTFVGIFYYKYSTNAHSFKYTDVEFMDSLWRNYFKEPVDTKPVFWGGKMNYIKKEFFNCEWNKVYDFIEFTAQNYLSKDLVANFKTNCNKILEKEVSGYRFIENIIAPICGNTEIKEIENALKSPFKGVQSHLETALSLFSDRKQPDYRNSIKESISAVESICCLITKKPKATLGEAIKKLKENIVIHGSLESAFEKLYGYTSDEKGIRHKLIDEDNVSSEDALFMLVTCSAFINYLIVKTDKSKLQIN